MALQHCSQPAAVQTAAQRPGSVDHPRRGRENVELWPWWLTGRLSVRRWILLLSSSEAVEVPRMRLGAAVAALLPLVAMLRCLAWKRKARRG